MREAFDYLTFVLIVAVLAVLIFCVCSCSQYPVHGTLTYGGKYGDYSVSADGKGVAYDVRIKR